MAWEFSFTSDGAEHRLPRRFEIFDEAWDVARKLIDAYQLDQTEKSFLVKLHTVVC